jgi:DNA invertase Pin-like site-specific DNA recombinase
MARTENAVLYSRFSRLGGRDESKLRTLDAQEDRGESLAAQHGLNVVGSFEDRGKSGKNLKRPGLQEALSMIERGEASVLVSAKLSRVARRVGGLHEVVQRVDAAGGKVILGDLGLIDTKTAAGKFTMTVLGAVAEMELDLATEHGLEARTNAIADGIAIMARAPFGYLRPEVRLVPDPVKGPVMTEVFARRASGATWRELTDYIEAETGEYVTPQTLQKMIANPTYLGSVRSGKLVNADAHPPLTDEETWEAAQSAKRLNSARKHRSLLAGLMTCSGCGNPMTFRSVKRKGKPDYPVYTCQRQSADGRCPLPVTISASISDEAVSAAFLAWASGDVLAGDPRDASELAQADQALAEAEGELTRFLAADLRDVLDLGAWKGEVARRQEAVDAARDRLTALRQENRLEALQISVADRWDDLDSEGRRQLIAAALDGVIVHRTPTRGHTVAFSERAVITWRDA